MATRGTVPHAASAATGGATSSNNTSMTSLSAHPRKRSYELEFRQGYNYDMPSMDDSFVLGNRYQHHRKYSNPYAPSERKKSSGSVGSRKGKVRENSEGSIMPYAGRADNAKRKVCVMKHGSRGIRIMLTAFDRKKWTVCFVSR